MITGKERFKFNERIQPIADVIYGHIFPKLEKIERFAKGNEVSILDSEFGIDVKLSFKTMVITGQEKFRSYHYHNKRDITVELYNDPTQRIEGDWFKLASQFYFVGYANEDNSDLDLWILLDWLMTVLETQRGNITWRIQQNIHSQAKANFVYTSMDTIPTNCVIAKQLSKE